MIDPQDSDAVHWPDDAIPFLDSAPLDLSELLDTVAPFDRVDLLQAAGALLLVPENANRYLRISALAYICTCGKGTSNAPKVSKARLNEILHSPPLTGSIASAEDDQPNPFTESFSYHGGPYIVFPGFTEDCTFVLRAILDSLRKWNQHADFLADVRQIVESTLALSTMIAKRARIQRNVSLPEGGGDQVLVPASEHARRLKSSITFTRDELLHICGGAERLNLVESLCTEIGANEVADYHPDQSSLYSKPIVRCDQELYVVALPNFLVPALTERIVAMAVQRGILHDLTNGFHESIQRKTCRNLEDMGWIPVGETEVTSPPDVIVDGFHVSLSTWRFDSDKISIVVLSTDALLGVENTAVFGHLDFANFEVWLKSQLAPYIERLVDQYRNFEFMTLIAINGFGRSYGVNVDSVPQCRHVFLAAGELDVIAKLETNQPLRMWNYARAIELTRGKCSFICFGQLDRFWFYRKHKHTFYFTDQRADMVSIVPASSRELREEANRIRDAHAAPSSDGGNSLVEVELVAGERDGPFYAARSEIDHRVAILVELPAISIWVRSPDIGRSASFKTYFYLASSITYWFFECSDILEPLFHVLGTTGPFFVEIKLKDEAAWINLEFTEGQSDLLQTSFLAENCVAVEIENGLMHAMAKSDNVGEIMLFASIVDEMRRTLDGGDPFVGKPTIEVIEERTLPTYKKKILLSPGNHRPQLDRNFLTRNIKFDELDSAVLLDEVGKFLSTKGHQEGPISRDQRCRVLGEVVAFIYEKLQHEVALLPPKGVVEFLIDQQECLSNDDALSALTTPTKLACHMSRDEIVQALQEETLERSRKSIANRFLLEYIAARPPSGNEVFSVAKYNKLLAIAMNIFSFAYQSDLINYDLADMSLRMLPSGRLGSNREAFETAGAELRRLQAANSIDFRINGFERFWRSTTKDVPDSPMETELDDAIRDELGLSLSHIVIFLNALSNLKKFSTSSVYVGAESEVVDEVVTISTLTRSEVVKAIEVLSLSPRADFLNPPSPFTKEDVYPWRFARRMSCLRRPLIRRFGAGEPEIIFGKRFVQDAIDYLISSCLSGRIKATSGLLKKWISREQNKASRDFNEAVGGRVKEVLSADVHLQVKKIGKLRGLDRLGDIDVLAFDPRKKRVWVIECKDLEIARTPVELVNERKNLFVGSEHTRSATEKLKRRYGWVGENLEQILNEYGQRIKGNWRVLPLIVVSTELLMPRLTKSAIPVVSYRGLKEFLRSH